MLIDQSRAKPCMKSNAKNRSSVISNFNDCWEGKEGRKARGLPNILQSQTVGESENELKL